MTMAPIIPIARTRSAQRQLLQSWNGGLTCKSLQLEKPSPMGYNKECLTPIYFYRGKEWVSDHPCPGRQLESVSSLGPWGFAAFLKPRPSTDSASIL